MDLLQIAKGLAVVLFFIGLAFVVLGIHEE